MKNNFSDFVSSIYSPRFYKSIPTKSLKTIFAYMVQICVVVALATAILVTITSVTYNLGTPLPITFVLSVFSIFVAILMSMFVTWLLYAFILGILIMLISMVFRRKISYTVSIKTALYAMSLGMIFFVVSIIGQIPFLGEVISIVIVLINIKSVPKMQDK